MAAAWVVLDREIGPAGASAVIGGVLLMIAVILLVIAQRRPAKTPRAKAAAAGAAAPGGGPDEPPRSPRMPETIEEALAVWLTVAGMPPPPVGTSGAVLSALMTGLMMGMSSRGPRK